MIKIMDLGIEFKKITDYCLEKNIENIEDITMEDFIRISNLKNLRKNNFNKFISLCEEVLNKKINIDSYLEKINNYMIFNDINEEIVDIELEALIFLGIKRKIVKELLENGYMKIGDLKEIKKMEFLKIFGKKNETEFFESINNLVKNNFKDFFGILLKNISESSDFIMIKMKSEGKTLEEIGNFSKGITRERVRQIISSFNKKISLFMNVFLEKHFRNKEFIEVEELLGIYDNDDFDLIILNWAKKMKNLKYLDYADIFIENNEKNSNIDKKLLDIAEEIVGESIDLYENLEQINDILCERGYEYINFFSFINFLRQNGYNVCKNFAFKNRSYGFMSSKIVEKYFKNGIKLTDDNEIKILREYIKEELGNIEVSEDNRNFRSRITDNLVLYDKGTYISSKEIKISDKLLLELEEYIEKNENKNIYYSSIFETFKEKLLKDSNIHNHYFLHGVLKEYFKDNYDFLNKDYIVKFNDNNISFENIYDKIIKYIESLGRPVSKKELDAEIPGITNIMLSTRVNNSKELFYCGNDYYNLIKNVNLDDDDINKIKNTIINLLEENKGYCNAKLLFENIKIDKIKDYLTLYYISQKLFYRDFDFKLPHICKKDLFDDISSNNILKYFFCKSDTINYSEIINFVHKSKLNGYIIKNFIEEIELEYIRLDNDTFIKKEKFNISKKEIEDIRLEITNNMQKGYYSLIKKENSFLLKSIIKNYIPSLKIISPNTNDVRYEKGIILLKDSKIVDYQELVYEILFEKQIFEIKENDMLKFLIENRLTNKTIPLELKTSYYFTFDEEKALFKLNK